MSETVVGLQGERGSFHEGAADVYYGNNLNVRYLYFQKHHAQMNALFDPGSELHEAVIAVDNTTSGRVMSSINALTLHPGYKIKGCVTIPIEQYLLMVPGQSLDSLEAVLSQRPALDQCTANILRAGLKAEEYHDTAAAARHLMSTGGMYHDYSRVAAIGSKKAGAINGLEIGPLFSDNPNNATKFWVVTDDEVDNAGTHTALTFEVPDRPGGLRKAVGYLSVTYGLNLTDIDSHLAHANNKRAFFTEVEHEDPERTLAAVGLLESEGFNPKVLGSYTPINDFEFVDVEHNISNILDHGAWKGRNGLVYPDGSYIAYVETNHLPEALYNMLGHLEDCNLVDLGRPTIPIDNQLNRGFYVVIDPSTPAEVRTNALLALERDSDFKLEAA